VSVVHGPKVLRLLSLVLTIGGVSSSIDSKGDSTTSLGTPSVTSNRVDRVIQLKAGETKVLSLPCEVNRVPVSNDGAFNVKIINKRQLSSEPLSQVVAT
jgi:hypothetical protein